MSHRAHRTRGFALLTVLWITVVLSVIGSVAVAESTAALHASRNRVALARAEWIASGCVSAIQAIADVALLEAPDDALKAERWRLLGQTIESRAPSVRSECEIEIRADGDRLNVTTASARELMAFFKASGLGDERVDLVDALLDWMDVDDSTRANGAEAGWYRAQGRVVPRNGPVADTAELRFIRGFEELDGRVLQHLTGEGGRVAVNSAPRPVLLALPGFTKELVDRLRERSDRSEPLHDLVALPTLVSGDAAELVRANYPEIARAATVDPEAWLVLATVRLGSPQVSSTLEARLVRGVSGTERVRWRIW